MDPKYKLGIAELDEQHEAIEATLLALLESIEQQDRWHVMHYILEDLIGKLTGHFTLEEAVMRMFAYPKVEEHVRAHRELLSAIERYRQTLISQPAGDSKPPFGLFYDQILGHDTHLAAYLREIKGKAGLP